MGERLFNALYELNISKIQLFPSSGDSESSLALVANRFQFMGYEVMIQTEPTEKYRTSAACDSIAAAIRIFRRSFRFRKWLHLLNAEPQTQIGIEKADTELHISASIHGAGINVIVVKQV